MDENKNQKNKIPNKSKPMTEKISDGVIGKNKELDNRIFKIAAVVLAIVVIIFLVRKSNLGLRDRVDPGATDDVISVGTAEWGFKNVKGDFSDRLPHVKWTRTTGLVWPKVQDIDGNINWEFFDAPVIKAQERNYNEIFVVKTGHHEIVSDPDCYEAVKANEDSKPTDSCPIKQEYEDDWKSLIFNIIERYDGDGKDDMPGLEKDFVLDIQIENEAGSPGYWYFNEIKDGKKAADEYLKILRLAYEAKEEANPSTKIIIPGLIKIHRLARCEKGEIDPRICNSDFIMRNTAFTKEVLKYPEIFDAIEIHEYNYFKFDPYYVQDGIDWIKKEMKNNGYNKPIYSFEWLGSMAQRIKSEGFEQEFLEYFPYSDEFSDLESLSLMYQNLDTLENKKYRDWFDTEQAREFSKMFTTLLVNDVTKLVHSRFTDLFRGFPGQWDSVFWNWQGLIKYETTSQDPILVKKPSYYTYNITVDRIANFSSARELDFGRNTFVYEFKFDNKDPVYIAWTEGLDKTINLKRQVSSRNVNITHIVTELDSNNNPIYKDDETYQTKSILITNTPVFIE